ncbi:non-ribosomal peptide synthetase [Dolichospermum sp. UHCC 0259]|uniref:non-ribosomal peptide synthetase n=1 Tax=Dolichospermum sp. UHCC 0259 TaxID=2590010 RepID=UPI001448514E|nr:non-ribosomal peptide synthetase [Dolichospermum sp. UHCC 0259]MTJ48121.1 amino acid adenylation domain-containing protein [Dolichospermum sp. UHCC 0259]
MQTQVISGFQLAPQQKRLWNLQQNSSAFCSQCSILIDGNLRLEILENTLQKIINDHDILKTNFYSLPGAKNPVMVFGNQSLFDWEYLDLSNLSQEDIAEKIQELFWQARQEYQNKSQDLPLRLCLIKLLDNQHIFMISLPALCADNRTIKNLVNQISQGYEKCFKGKELNLNSVQYVQFSEWQNQLLTDEDAAEAQAYWQQQKINSLSALKLPNEQTKKSNKFITDRYKLAISQELSDAIDEFAKKYDMKLDIILLACWQILIWRLTGESEIVIGTAASRREYEELNDVLGLLANWLPIKTKFTPNLNFIEVLAVVKQTLENATEWQDYFVPEAVETDGLIAFPIGFEFNNISVHNSDDIEVKFTLQEIYSLIEPFKVKLSCLQDNHSLVAEFYYDINCFSQATIQRLAKNFQTLLINTLNNSNIPISELEILSDSECQQLLVEFNQTKIEYDREKCIHELFAEQVEKTPNQVAVVFENEEITYKELNCKANQLAHYLKKQGVQPDFVVGLCVERSLEMIVGLLGILKAGGVYLPLESNLPTEALNLRLQEAKTSLVITQQSLINRFEKEKVIAIDADWENIAVESNKNPHTEVKPENLVYVIFTSGSTGKPKGVAAEHRQLFNYINAIAHELNLPTTANYATVSSLSADLGNTMIFPSLCRGGCLHIISSARVGNAVELAEYCRQHPIDCLKIVPSHLAAFLSATPLAVSIIPRQCLILGGEIASWKLISQIQQQAPNCQIFNHYGPTETTIGVLTYAVANQDDELTSETVPLGRPLANTQVYILDEDLKPVPLGVRGELYISGAGLSRGYLNQPELTAERFIYHSFLGQDLRLYKTGDRVRYLEDGNIEFLGRVDNQVKIRGFRIELAEIELTLGQHPTIQQAVVTVQQSENNQRLIAYLVPQAKATININELRSFLKQKLPDYMLPSAFGILKKLPLTPNGKIDRQALPDIESLSSELAVKYEPPKTEIEQAIAQLWQQLLQIGKVGINDNFFDIGGHSLLLVQVHAKLRDMFPVDIAITHLFAHPTISSLSEYLTQAQPKTATLVETQQRAANRKNAHSKRRN